MRAIASFAIALACGMPPLAAVAAQDCRSDAVAMQQALPERDLTDPVRREVDLLAEAALAFADLDNMEACAKALAEAREVLAGRKQVAAAAPAKPPGEPAGAAPAAAPAAPAAATAATGAGAVYFDSGQTRLSADAVARVRTLAAIAKKSGQAVKLDGYTDPSGPPELNLRLSKQRVERVAAAFRAAGIPKDRIAMQWHGESKPGEAVEGPTARRVEIELVDRKPGG